MKTATSYENWNDFFYIVIEEISPKWLETLIIEILLFEKFSVWKITSRSIFYDDAIKHVFNRDRCRD